MVSIGNKKYRNLQEQVGYNTECIQELAEAIDGITLEDKLVIIANDSGTFTDEEMTVLSGPLAFISDGSKVWLKQSETASEFVFKAIDIVATEQGGTHYDVGGSKIVVTRATRAYVTSDDVIITTYDKTQIDALLSAKASLSGANFTGAITSPSIIETMTGFSANANTFLSNQYVSVAKTGNKITFVIAGTLTPSASFISNGGDWIGRFYLPQAILDKLYPIDTFGSNILRVGLVPSFSSQTDYKTGKYRCEKLADGIRIVYLTSGASLVADTPYAINIEMTFLLNDSLA